MTCYVVTLQNGAQAFLCGDLGPHCKHCADVGVRLCDWPMKAGLTCDAPLCDHHAFEIAEEIHYCPVHHEQYKRMAADDSVLPTASTELELRRRIRVLESDLAREKGRSKQPRRP